MIYNFEERINRVINNHQFTCQHRSHYLFVLRGFEPILENITLNVLPLDQSNLSNGTNYWITYEDAFDIETTVWDALKANEYDIWIVNFNFFDGVYFASVPSHSHLTSNQSQDVEWVTYKDNPHLLERKTLNVFNTNNPLIGIVPDIKSHLSNEQRLELLPVVNLS